ncbi:MAG: acyl-CoA dehydrogenase [Francisellaceae bacterium]|jgi:acyl-CoA dehydrogenase
MSNLSSIINDALAKDEFKSYQEFEEYVLSSDYESPLLTVLSVALRVTSIGQAFSVGYRGALQCLLPSLDTRKWAAFCVSEISGVRPKNLTTKVSPTGVLTGSKSFVSMANSAEQLIVVAVSSNNGDRPVLKAVLVNLPDKKVKQILMPPMNMMPDVKHGGIELEGAVGEILPGDGHNDYNKRFRTIEDAHLLTAFIGLILSKTVRYKLNDEIIDGCILILSSLTKLSFDESPWNTFQLFAAYEMASKIILQFESGFEILPNEFKQDWIRDKKIFSMTKSNRATKRERALKQLASK